MKEYTITMNFLVEADDDSDYEKISEFSEQLSENIMSEDKLIYGDGIEIVTVQIHEVEDHNNYEDNIYLDSDDE